MKKLITLLAAAMSFAALPAVAQAPAAAPKAAEAKPMEAKPAEAAGPTDPQIAAIVVAANQVDIDAGKMAEKTTKSADVKAFAKQMVTDHTAVNKQATELCTKLKVKPEPNDTSKSLIKGGKDSNASLKKLKGAEFDKAYVDHEVAYHEQVLEAIDKVLIPNAKNAELKGLIEKVRPAIAEHLEHAKTLQSKLAAPAAK